MAVVKLSVHKNNRAQKMRKEVRTMAMEDIKKCIRPSDLAGYCIVSWSDEGDSNVAWHIGADSPVQPERLADFVSDRIRTRRLLNHIED